MSNIARIAITAGEPAGIGPDLCIQLAQQPRSYELTVIADPAMLQQRAMQLGLPLNIEIIDTNTENNFGPIKAAASSSLRVLPVTTVNQVIAGQLDKRNANYVLETLNLAIDGCMSGRFDAMVTAPVHKGIMNDAGITFTGHTEFLAERSNTPLVVMMLATPGLRVALVTTHLPLREICDAITQTLIEDIISIVNHDLKKYFSIAQPRLLVCGLNPHAGENGHLGREDEDTIVPALAQLRNAGLHIKGPLPADTLFIPKYLDQCDAVIAMYHDQGLPVLKHKGFGEAVNITLGLPFIRTSVDHGTALELAGKGGANAGSLRYALDVALEMIQHRSPFNSQIRQPNQTPATI